MARRKTGKTGGDDPQISDDAVEDAVVVENDVVLPGEDEAREGGADVPAARDDDHLPAAHADPADERIAGTGAVPPAPEPSPVEGDGTTDAPDEPVAAEGEGIVMTPSDEDATTAEADGPREGTDADTDASDPPFDYGVAGADGPGVADAGDDAPREDRTSDDVAPREDRAVPAPVPAAATAPESRGPGFVPLLLGGIVAGGIGYAAATWLPVDESAPAPAFDVARVDAVETELADLRAGLEALPDDAPAAAVVDLSALEGGQADLAGRIEALAARVDALEARSAPQPAAADGAAPAAPAFDPAPLQGDLASVRDAVAALQADVDAVRGTLDESLAGVRDQIAALEAGQSDLAARVDAAEAAVGEGAAALRSEIGGAVDALRADLAPRVETLEGRAEELASIADEAEAEAAAAARRAALNEISTSLRTGTPFADPLATLEDPPEALAAVAESGVPTSAALADRFGPASREALRAARETGAGAEPGLRGFARSLVNARSLEPREGDDADAVLSRAGAALREGDIAAALAEIETLPPEVGAPLEDWAASARARLAAQRALQDLLEG
ncbi:COG4223 family protein [Jannaschia sp. W003]|uniref:COG4223 family protein n=1 Tax=Jannaschia sp. W003 TaxID=2867012 RepID=UPI0021A3F5C5|nr:mitofilin family membrane protein [Jannaschia sp. W003]UWQ22374.1 hypothetical protein K3554_04880 [Jannaschia sp. W003]